jgi:hypothetical protein
MSDKNKKIAVYVLIVIIIFVFAYFLGSRNKSSTQMVYPSETASSPKPSGNTYDYTEAKSHEGEFANITGTVVQVYTTKSNTTFFDFCSSYKNCGFSAVVFSSALSSFSNIKQYEGKNITINGLIKDYQGNAEIIINSPEQIKIN